MPIYRTRLEFQMEFKSDEVISVEAINAQAEISLEEPAPERDRR